MILLSRISLKIKDNYQLFKLTITTIAVRVNMKIHCKCILKFFHLKLFQSKQFTVHLKKKKKLGSISSGLLYFSCYIFLGHLGKFRLNDCNKYTKQLFIEFGVCLSSSGGPLTTDRVTNNVVLHKTAVDTIVELVPVAYGDFRTTHWLFSLTLITSVAGVWEATT